MVLEIGIINPRAYTILLIKKDHTWDSKRRWVACDSQDFRASCFFMTSFMLGLTQVFLVQYWTTKSLTSKHKEFFLLVMSEKAQRVVSMWDSKHSCLSIPHLKFLWWMHVSKPVYHMVQMESIATIGMTTFWTCWSSFEWQPLMCRHLLDKLFGVFCASSN